MKTTDILLDAQFSFPNATREDGVVKIEGVKYSIEITLSTITRGFKSFCVFDPDGDLFTDYDSVLLGEWIFNFVLDNLPASKPKPPVVCDHTFRITWKGIQAKTQSSVIVKADSKEDAENFGIARYGEPDGWNWFLRVDPISDEYEAEFDVRLEKA